MKWIKLTQANDEPIFVNIFLARDVFSKSGITTVSFDGEYYLKVKETPEQIIELSK